MHATFSLQRTYSSLYSFLWRQHIHLFRKFCYIWIIYKYFKARKNYPLYIYFIFPPNIITQRIGERGWRQTIKQGWAYSIAFDSDKPMHGVRIWPIRWDRERRRPTPHRRLSIQSNDPLPKCVWSRRRDLREDGFYFFRFFFVWVFVFFIESRKPVEGLLSNRLILSNC